MCDDSEDAEAAASASDLEDLREQLSRQDEVYRGLREEISRETEKGEEFRELLGQLQKGGRFLDPAATLGAVGRSRSEDHVHLRDTCCLSCELRKENRLMTLEVEALKARLLETQSDGAALRAKFERKDSILERQAEEERDLESEEGRRASEGREAEIEAGIAQLQREVEKARRERDLAAVELTFQKAQWREANGKFLQLLGSNGDCDIDKLLTDSISLKKQLDEDSVSVEEDEKPAGLTRSGYKIRAKRVKQLLELEMLPKNEMQRMALAILEAIEIKDNAIENARLKNKTLGTHLTSLGKYLSESETAEIDDKSKTREQWKTELLKKTSIANENFNQVTFHQPQQKPAPMRRSKSTVM